MRYEGGGPADPALQPAQAAPVPPPRVSPTFTFRNRLYHRRQGFVLVPRLTCPLNHRVRKAGHIHDSGAHYCEEKVGETLRPRGADRYERCGALVYVFPLVFPGLGDEALHVWASDVEYSEVLALERMKFCDRLAYLGAVMPEVAMVRRA